MTLVAIEAFCKGVVFSLNPIVLHSSYSYVQTVPLKIAVVEHALAVIHCVNVLGNLCLAHLAAGQSVSVIVSWTVDRAPLALADVNELV
jgi:hypothetical protein